MSQMVFQQKPQGGPYIPPWAFMNRDGGNKRSPGEQLALMMQSQNQYSPMEEMKAAVMGKAAIESLKHAFSEEDRELDRDLRKRSFDMESRLADLQTKMAENAMDQADKEVARAERQRKGDVAGRVAGMEGLMGAETHRLDTEFLDHQYQVASQEIDGFTYALADKFEDYRPEARGGGWSGDWFLSHGAQDAEKYINNAAAKLASIMANGTDAQVAAARDRGEGLLELLRAPVQWYGGGPDLRIRNWDNPNVQRFRAIMENAGVRQKAQDYRNDSFRMSKMQGGLDLKTKLMQFMAVTSSDPEGVEVDAGLMKELDALIERATGLGGASLPPMVPVGGE